MLNLRHITISTKRFLHLSPLQARGPLVYPGWYPRDHKPGLYPETPEDYRAAAIKYGLRPEDYKPFAKDDVVHYSGNYPDLGIVTFDHKDPYESYSDPLNRRNWGEPVIFDFMKHRADRNSYNGLDIEDFNWWYLVSMTVAIVGPMCLFAWIVSPSDPNHFAWKMPYMPKQYAYDYLPSFPYEDPRKYPITNYTFEPAE